MKIFDIYIPTHSVWKCWFLIYPWDGTNHFKSIYQLRAKQWDQLYHLPCISLAPSQGRATLNYLLTWLYFHYQMTFTSHQYFSNYTLSLIFILFFPTWSYKINFRALCILGILTFCHRCYNNFSVFYYLTKFLLFLLIELLNVKMLNWSSLVQ